MGAGRLFIAQAPFVEMGLGNRALEDLLLAVGGLSCRAGDRLEKAAGAPVDVDDAAPVVDRA